MQTKTMALYQTLLHKDGSTTIQKISLKVQSHLISNRNVEVSKLLSEKIIPIVMECTHYQLTTLLDFTGVTPYEIWYFDHKKQFSGKTFNFHQGNGTFRVETQARFILLWKIIEDKNVKTLQLFNPIEYSF